MGVAGTLGVAGCAGSGPAAMGHVRGRDAHLTQSGATPSETGRGGGRTFACT